MTFQLTVLYLQPDDPAAFDAYYEATHAPLARRIPGLRGYSAMHPGARPDGSAQAEYLVATLLFDDEAALGEGLGSPEGDAAARDIRNFATGGATMLIGEVTTYV